jgi:S-adenosylmethionine:tRNA ribosyltransferase-isomerase
VTPAGWPRATALDEGLLVVDPTSARTEVKHVRDLPAFIGPRDVVVVNDAATLPASLRGVTAEGAPIEARLLACPEAATSTWRAALFGAGDWRTRTENREPPPSVRVGDAIAFGPDLVAHVTRVAGVSARLVDLRFDATPDRFWAALYRRGRPVQYAHVAAPLALWHVQTAFASRPWASEMPSAARPLAWEVLVALRKQGTAIARITHAAGLSSTGDPELDAALPLRESFEVDADAVRAVCVAKARGGRVIAVGTTVVRALESAAERDGGALVPSHGETELLLGPARPPRIVDAIFTGMHEPGSSHDALLQAFAPVQLLRRARAEAESHGFLDHEFGDSMLIARGALGSLSDLAATC